MFICSWDINNSISFWCVRECGAWRHQWFIIILLKLLFGFFFFFFTGRKRKYKTTTSLEMLWINARRAEYVFGHIIFVIHCCSTPIHDRIEINVPSLDGLRDDGGSGHGADSNYFDRNVRHLFFDMNRFLWQFTSHRQNKTTWRSSRTKTAELYIREYPTWSHHFNFHTHGAYTFIHMP